MRGTICQECGADCCRDKGGFSVRLLEHLGEVERFEEHVIWREGVPVLPVDEDGKCVLLAEDMTCSVNADKPELCKRFVCAKLLDSAACIE